MQYISGSNYFCNSNELRLINYQPNEIYWIVMTAWEMGQIMAIKYSLLAMILRSLLLDIPYVSHYQLYYYTCNYTPTIINMYIPKGDSSSTWPHTTIACSQLGYVLRCWFGEYPVFLTLHLIMSWIEKSTLQTRNRTIITAPFGVRIITSCYGCNWWPGKLFRIEWAVVFHCWLWQLS